MALAPLGVHLTLLIGPTVAVPAPLPLTERLAKVKVIHSDEGRSGFQLTFHTGRAGLSDLLDYPLAGNPLLKNFNRVILVVTFGVMPKVLMDGIITRQEFTPGERPGQATLTVTGEDVSCMMDREDRSAEHPAQDETIVAIKLIGSYAQYGLIPMVIPPPALDPPIPIERIPVQQGTDLAHLQAMAKRHGYVFYVSPGPAPFTNTAYWGPPVRTGLPQRAITVNMGPETNAKLSAGQTNGLAPTKVEGRVQDRQSGQQVPVISPGAPLRPPLASQPEWLVSMPHARTTQLRESGVSVTQAYARAQGMVENASDAVTLDGELDAGRYGDVLQARSLVGVRGAGFSHDGFYYVKRVTHELEPGAYKQSFALTREGKGSTTPVVVP
jgi:hypothetical protein